jgi:NADP-dependent 3-hydroxy acid dehydrogenase YdfG
MPPASIPAQENHVKNNIRGKVVVIVDGASRLGAAAAHHLSNEGATVVLGGAELLRVRALAHELRWNGGKSIAAGVDASDGAQLEDLLAAAVQAYGRVDVIPCRGEPDADANRRVSAVS